MAWCEYFPVWIPSSHNASLISCSMASRQLKNKHILKAFVKSVGNWDSPFSSSWRFPVPDQVISSNANDFEAAVDDRRDIGWTCPNEIKAINWMRRFAIAIRLALRLGLRSRYRTRWLGFGLPPKANPDAHVTWATQPISIPTIYYLSPPPNWSYFWIQVFGAPLKLVFHVPHSSTLSLLDKDF